MNARNSDGQRPMDLATNKAMMQAIVNEEKRRRDHGFKRSVIPPTPPTNVTEQESNENGDEGQANVRAGVNVEEEEDDDDNDDDSDSSDEDDAN